MSNNKDNIKVYDLGPSVGNGEDRPRFLDPVKHSYLLRILSPDARNRVEDLIEIQKVHDGLKEEFYKERGALEAKYEKCYQPLYDKRYNIVNGVTSDSEGSATTNQEEKGVPNFWLYALGGNGVMNDVIMEHDEGALQHLENIKWLRTDNLRVFKLEFYFRPNPFFKNSILTMTYHMIDDDEIILEKVIGTKIQWYSENHLKKDKTGRFRSFFNFFSPTEVHDEYKDLELKCEMQGNYFIGSTFRDEIIPRAILCLSPDVKANVDRLKNIQSDHDELKKMFYKERAKLEAKYQKMFQNLYDKRYDIVNGVVKANDFESAINQERITNRHVKAPDEKRVPNFWRHALVNHELVDAETTLLDGRALRYLKDTYEFLDEDETILYKAIGLKIEWYPENCLTQTQQPKKELKNFDIRRQQCESFFNFFDPLPIDKNAPEEHIKQIRRDLYIGLTIRDEIIPRAVLWYVGEAAQGEMEVDFGESEDEEGDEN
ncbi:hypothetical protein M0R45_013372 [Rubus argutus]|uniref:Nucleosome assembly protein n=1 Tax=Rubus argutus TaxID=59490 RepID=A0AAW1XJU7_RUBAR